MRSLRFYRLSRLRWFAMAGLGAFIVVLMSCAGQGAPGSSQSTRVMQGHVIGGQQPVSGASIALFSAGATGYGSGALQLLTLPVTSDASGGFDITGDYPPCTPGSLVYLVATGGNPGAGTNNSLALMTALGPCGNLTPSTFIMVNELTTVAAAYALAPFMTTNGVTPGANVGTSPGNATGLTNALATAALLVDTSTGRPGGSTLPAGATVPISELNTLADILATCVNTNGASGECATLFTAATPGGGSAPTNTIDAALDIALNPGNSNLATLSNAVTGTAPFQPTLSSPPNDWTVAISYTGGGLSAPTALAVDSAQNIWVANSTANSLTEYSNSGSVLSGTGYTGGGLSSPVAAAIDNDGNIWLTNATGSVSDFTPAGTAVSGSGGITAPAVVSPQGIAAFLDFRIFSANTGTNSVAAFSGGGYVATYTDGGLSSPYGVAISGAFFWITNGNNSLTQILSDDTASANFTGGGLNSPRGIAVDNLGNLWIANNGNASLSEFDTTGTPITTSSGYTGGGLVDPSEIAVDGLQNVWVTNPTGNSLSEFSNSGAAISGASGYTAGGLGTLGGMGIDGSGNVWVAVPSTNTIAEIVGAAAPVITPLAHANTIGQIATRP